MHRVTFISLVTARVKIVHTNVEYATNLYTKSATYKKKVRKIQLNVTEHILKPGTAEKPGTN